MTPIQQTALAKYRATAEANMAFFQRNIPGMHQMLLSEPLRSSLDISDQGDLHIRYPDGTTRSVTEAVLEAEARLAEFADLNLRPQILAFHRLRSISDAPSHGDMAKYHYTDLDADYPNRLKWHFCTHYPDNRELKRYPEFGGKDIPLVVVIGSELGWHLPRLLNEYRIRHLIVMETDLDAFRLSTFLHDYVLTSRIAMERGTNLSFLVQPDIEQLSRALMSVMRKDLPPYFVHGTAVFYVSRQEETVKKIQESVVRTLWELFFGLGYFDDELISIQHTFDNLRDGFPIYQRPNVMPEDAVALIVGNGPSLDGLLPLLREYGDRAVIFSCGTSLSALAKAGIKPDFHVEKERPYLTYELITKSVSPEFLKGIRFIGLNVVHGDVYRLFDWGGQILKSADTMALLMMEAGAPREIILNTQPTVTNTALDLCVSAGFRKVYLLGVDMGYKDEKQQHSTHSLYEEMTDDEDLNDLLSQMPEASRTIPGNFGGQVSTNNILAVARQYLEWGISHHPRSRVFNLSDGALIKGAEPLHAADFSCDATPAGKAAAIGALQSAFGEMHFDLKAIGDSLLAQIDAYIAGVRNILSAPYRNLPDLIDILARLYRHLLQEEAAARSSFTLFRGTLLHLTSLTFNAVTIIKDEDEALAKAQYDFSVIQDFLNQARADVARVINAPSHPPSGDAS
jgi:hypothetical protein